MRILLFITLCVLPVSLFSQKKESKSQTRQSKASASLRLETDSLDFSTPSDSTNKIEAIRNIIHLKNNVLVVRLKSNERSIQAYKQAGRKILAEKIENENRERNLKIMTAFKNGFDFCPVYFIYAKNTKELFEDNQKIFLNDSLEIDTTIWLHNCDFYIVEYGTVMSNERTDEWQYKGVKYTEESSNPATGDALFISDRDLKQLKEPLPFYNLIVFNNYNKAALHLSLRLWNFYVKNASPVRMLSYMDDKKPITTFFYSPYDFIEWLDNYSANIPPNLRTKLFMEGIKGGQGWGNPTFNNTNWMFNPNSTSPFH